MSDLHPMPLRGHDLPETPPAPVRRRAHVWLCKPPLLRDWWWEHQCSANVWDCAGGYASQRDACNAAVRHLKECCMSDSEEEMVAVNLGDDYYQGAYFSADSAYGHRDYLVPRSQLERWEAAKAAYEDMQSEIAQVMDEQRERVRALRAERPKSQFASFLEQIYEPTIRAALDQQVQLNAMLGEEVPE